MLIEGFFLRILKIMHKTSSVKTWHLTLIFQIQQLSVTERVGRRIQTFLLAETLSSVHSADIVMIISILSTPSASSLVSPNAASFFSL